VMLIDTPGIRATHDAIEQAAIHASSRQIEQSEMILLVIDATRPLAGEQREMLSRFANATVVVNKSDRPFANGIETVAGIHTIATTGNSVDELRRAIVAFFCGSDSIRLDRPSVWTSRQRAIIERALDDIAVLREL
jgi:tRNA modification GTPase